MHITSYIAFILGLTLEILLLWENARQRDKPARKSGLEEAFLSPEKQLMVALAVFAGLLIGVLYLIGWDDRRVYIDGLMSIPFAAIIIGLLVYGLILPYLLPRINEEAALSIHIVVALNLILTRPFELPWWPHYALGLGIPWLLLLAATLPNKPPPLVKAGIYWWYLINLLALTLQTDFSVLNEPAYTPLPLGEAFVLGAGAIFLLLHAFFCLRFTLMLSSVINPLGAEYMRLVIPQLFGDEQLPLVQVLLLQAFAAGVIFLNVRFDIAPNLTVVTLLVMAFAQGIPLLKGSEIK